MPLQRGSERRRQRGVLLAGVAVLLLALVLAAVLASALTRGKEEARPEPLRWQGRGTTRNLREIVLGRCYGYLAERRAELGDKDCLKIWESLKDAFIHKNPCNATTEDYQPLMELASHPISCNKSLFWSKTKDLVHLYTKSSHRFLTLEDTFLGYMLDGISWCGDPSAPVLLSQYVSSKESTMNLVQNGVNVRAILALYFGKWHQRWTEITKIQKFRTLDFAEAACGVVQVMLNGSIETGAFRSSSIFGSIEILNLNPDKVSEIHIWVMHNIGGPQRNDIHLISNMLFDFHIEFNTCVVALLYFYVATKYLFLCLIPGQSSSFSAYIILTTQTAVFAPTARKLRETECSTLFKTLFVCKTGKDMAT
ncbi:hypothetical protein ASZ78_014544 [Callipepla squamata]|uniref:ADP-ribosyl cyclase/cyclic ADP-ribose hydrolase 1 n=1 Tax=Callipepla squamata TaxID=9009 RepID=A0A226MEN8_CALSU|nr:hypothetical protein ASZ78_014544 [Callipepla squamata]